MVNREILVLCTGWEPDYWEKKEKTYYPRKLAESVTHLKQQTPIPGIGAYTKYRDRDLSHQPPAFIIIEEIGENERKEPTFKIRYLGRIGGLKSRTLFRELGRQELLFTVGYREVRGIFEKYGVKPPKIWMEALRSLERPEWMNWIGAHYLTILEYPRAEDYEDIVADIFTALGFEVDQMGHLKEGEYPDGILHTREYSIVYDCKDIYNYYIDAKSKRAMRKYIEQARKRIKEERGITRVYFAYIAHSFNRGGFKNLAEIEKTTGTKGLLITTKALLYLLYKKLKMGRKFLLADFEELITGEIIAENQINKVYQQ